MEKDIINPEFPHTCIIRRVSGVTPFKEGVSVTIYEGICRRESSSNIRTFKQGTSSVGQVVYGDFRICIPGNIPIQKGDIADVDFIIGENKNCVITHPNPSALRTKRYPEGRTEFYYSIPEV